MILYPIYWFSNYPNLVENPKPIETENTEKFNFSGNIEPVIAQRQSQSIFINNNKQKSFDPESPPGYSYSPVNNTTFIDPNINTPPNISTPPTPETPNTKESRKISPYLKLLEEYKIGLR